MDILLMSRIVFVTAMINIVFVLLVLFSCRCINMWKISSGLRHYGWFKKFFSWHCYAWYVLLPSIIVHAVFAIRLLGVPF